MIERTKCEKFKVKNRSRLLCKLAYLLSAALASFGNKGLLDNYGYVRSLSVYLFTIHIYLRSYIARVGRIIDTPRNVRGLEEWNLSCIRIRRPAHEEESSRWV